MSVVKYWFYTYHSSWSNLILVQGYFPLSMEYISGVLITIDRFVYAQRLQDNLVLPKQNIITEAENLPFSIISKLLPKSAEKNELMSVADSSRTVVPAQLRDFMDILANWHECVLVSK